MRDLSKIKVIFVDIDRTLTDSNKKVTLKNTQVIKKAVEKGIMVVLCSGRNYKYAEQKSIDACASKYIITNNGAQIYNYGTHESVYEDGISKDLVRNILEEFKEHNIQCILNTTNTRFATKGLKRKMFEDEYFFDDIKELKEEKILQIVAEADTYEDMNKIIAITSKYEEVNILNLSKAYIEKDKEADNYYADINKVGVNKGKGIEKFFEIFNIKKEESMCFGDYINDMDMFNACGFKVAMENASRELKEKADFVTLSNDDSGVGDFIEKYVLNDKC